jgi:hypothetical protein
MKALLVRERVRDTSASHGARAICSALLAHESFHSIRYLIRDLINRALKRKSCYASKNARGKKKQVMLRKHCCAVTPGSVCGSACC